MGRSAKILILNKEGIIEKMSYQRRAYESVDEKSLSSGGFTLTAFSGRCPPYTRCACAVHAADSTVQTPGMPVRCFEKIKIF